MGPLLTLPPCLAPPREAYSLPSEAARPADEPLACPPWAPAAPTPALGSCGSRGGIEGPVCKCARHPACPAVSRAWNPWAALRSAC